MIWIGLVLACGAGCSDFLDVQPKDKQGRGEKASRRSRIVGSLACAGY